MSDVDALADALRAAGLAEAGRGEPGCGYWLADNGPAVEEVLADFRRRFGYDARTFALHGRSLMLGPLAVPEPARSGGDMPE